MMPAGCIAACYTLREIQVINQTAAVQIGDAATFSMVWMAFFAHCVLHYFVLAKVMPGFKPDPHEVSTATYAKICKICPMTWFNTNPIHCLRSKYIHKHEPACVMAAYGKEHLQKANPAIGQYFEDSTFGGAYQKTKGLQDEQKESKMEDDAEKKASLEARKAED